MSPILLRPIREQIEHDRVVRQLYKRWRRRYAVAINPDREEEASVRAKGKILYPDVILTNREGGGGGRLHAVVEVETTESVNYLEAMAQWAPLAKVRGAFYLYVPAGFSDAALRFCDSNNIAVSEIWTYYVIGQRIRFSMSYRSKYATRTAKKTLEKPKTIKKAKTSKKKTSKKKIAKKTPSTTARTSKARKRSVKKKTKARAAVKSVRVRAKSKLKK